MYASKVCVVAAGVGRTFESNRGCEPAVNARLTRTTVKVTREYVSPFFRWRAFLQSPHFFFFFLLFCLFVVVSNRDKLSRISVLDDRSTLVHYRTLRRYDKGMFTKEKNDDSIFNESASESVGLWCIRSWLRRHGCTGLSRCSSARSIGMRGALSFVYTHDRAAAAAAAARFKPSKGR